MARNRDWAVLERLIDTIDARRGADPASSYVAKQLSKGRHKIAQKVGEEAVEVAIAAVAERRENLTAEAADLLFHLLVLLSHAEIDLADVLGELARREGVSGLDEKAARGPS